jgi:hypothetical protein
MQWKLADDQTISPGATVRWNYSWGGGPGGDTKAMGPMIATVAGSTLVTASNWVAAVNNGFSLVIRELSTLWTLRARRGPTTITLACTRSGLETSYNRNRKTL